MSVAVEDRAGGQAGDVEVLDAADLSRFEECYLGRNVPVIIRGLRERYPLEIFRWSHEYLADLLGDAPVPVMASKDGFLSYERNMEEMTFREFAARSFGCGRNADGYHYFRIRTDLLPPGHEDSERIDELAAYFRKQRRGKAIAERWEEDDSGPEIILPWELEGTDPPGPWEENEDERV